MLIPDHDLYLALEDAKRFIRAVASGKGRESAAARKWMETHGTRHARLAMQHDCRARARAVVRAATETRN